MIRQDPTRLLHQRDFAHCSLAVVAKLWMDGGQSEFFLCCVCHVGKTKRNTRQLQKLTQ